MSRFTVPNTDTLIARMKRLLGEELGDLERARGLEPPAAHRRGTAARRRRARRRRRAE